MIVDIMAFAAHPDDAELSCSGILALAKPQNLRTAICDVTYGELGTRGSVDIRKQESEAASHILQLDERINLGLRDGFFTSDEASMMAIIKVLRTYQPRIILINAPEDRHPDHGKGCALVKQAAFLSGLRRIETVVNDQVQTAFRPEKVFSYIQDRYLEPDVVVDISTVWETKLASILAYKSQFYDENSTEPSTYISSNYYLSFVKARAEEMGHKINVPYGEGLISHQKLGIKNIHDLF